MPPSLELCNTSNRPLQRVVRAGLEALDEKLAEADASLPSFVRQALEGFLACGDPARGFAWLRCPACDEHRLVPFSCGDRGFCPACVGRRMEERAQRWVDEVLPRVAVRQWVLTVPWPRRWLLARRQDLARGVLKIALAEIERWLRREGIHGGLPGGRGGSITVLQRFGSSLALNLHFHVLALDGLYERDEESGRLRWRRARAPATEEVEDLVVSIAERCERWLAAQGFGDEDEELQVDDDDAQGLIQAAAVAGRSAALGRKAKRFQVLGGKPYELPPRCASYGGYTLHAGVVIGAKNRKGLRQLCRYVCRPPLAKARLELRPGDRVRMHLKRAWSDGTGAFEFSALELVERLAALVPPPGKHQALFHGVLAANAGWRAQVVPGARKLTEEEVEARAEHTLSRSPSRSTRPRWTPWELLLERAFDVRSRACPRCGERMQLWRVIQGYPVALVFRGLVKDSRAPPEAAAS